MFKKSSAATRIFDGSDEMFFLLVPTGFLIACLILRGLGWSYPSDLDQRALISFAITFFGLTAAHNAFTYVLLFLPEFRQWRLTQKPNSIGKWSAIFFGAFLLFFVAGASRVVRHPWAGYLNVGAFGLLWLVNAWHTFRQHFGFSMLYNKNWLTHKQASPETKQTVARIERIERFFYTSASFTGTIGLTTMFIARNHATFIYIPFLGVSLLSCLGILYANLLYPKSLRKIKILYNLRVLLLPFVFIDLFAGSAATLIHNFEYWFVFKRAAAKSVAPWKTRLYLFGSLWIFLVTGASLLRKNGGLPLIAHHFLESHSWMTILILSFSWAVTSGHYYLDGKIFRFSDESTRKHIAPFFLAKGGVH